MSHYSSAYKSLKAEQERASTVGSSDAATTVAELYDRAMGSGVAKGDVEQIIPLVLARAGFEKRRLEAIEGKRAFILSCGGADGSF